ncbi:MAG: hypothetical protein GF388_00085, partial [Candidatus Aegiribacteria sp.]|nr:hypothetical protein [Candidatus Aegiribacteria sp.]
MKTLIVLLLISISLLYAEWIDFDRCQKQQVDFEIEECSRSGFTVRIQVHGVNLAPRSDGDRDFQVISIPGTNTGAYEPGYPQVPMASFLAALLEHSRVKWEVLSIDAPV